MAAPIVLRRSSLQAPRGLCGDGKSDLLNDEQSQVEQLIFSMFTMCFQIIYITSYDTI